MALFIDGPINGPDDLRRYESSLLDVAGAEGIDVTDKLELAHREASVELTAFLVRQGVLSGANRSLAAVLVTEPLAQWEALHTLALFFRDAYHNQLNDRFKGKWQEYAKLAKEALGRLYEIGVGMHTAPLPAARAPQVALAGGGLTPGIYYVAIAWRNVQGQQGNLSELVEITVESGQTIAVTGINAPQGATGFVVYAGMAPAELTAQTTDVPAESSWTAPPGSLIESVEWLPQQPPATFVTRMQGMLRG